MCRREQTDVDRLGLGGTDRAHDAFLQYAQQLDLQGERHVADFVEKERAAVGRLEKADPAGASAGKGALGMAEEFGFEQLFGNGAAVDGDERPLGARAGAVAISSAILLLRKMTPSIQASLPWLLVPGSSPGCEVGAESCRARSIFSSRIWLSKGLVR